MASLTCNYVSSGLGLAIEVLGEALQRSRDRQPERPSAFARLRAALEPLFPVTPDGEPPRAPDRRRRALSVAIQVAAVCAAAGLLLLRVAQVPAWNCAYAEDWGVYLPYAWQHPWHLYVPFNGYEQLLPR